MENDPTFHPFSRGYSRKEINRPEAVLSVDGFAGGSWATGYYSSVGTRRRAEDTPSTAAAHRGTGTPGTQPRRSRPWWCGEAEPRVAYLLAPALAFHWAAASDGGTVEGSCVFTNGRVY